MRTFPDHIDTLPTTTSGAGARAFSTAFDELVAARAAYDALHGDASRISELAAAAGRLERARAAVALARAA